MGTDMDLYELEYTNTPTTTVKFSLSGEDLNPDKITEVLGIPPSKAWAKGDTIPRKKGSKFVPGPRYPFGRWLLYAPSSKYDNFNIQINALLDVLEQLPLDINELIKSYSGEISIAYSSGEDKIGFHFDIPLIQRIHALGLEVDIIAYPIHDEDQ